MLQPNAEGLILGGGPIRGSYHQLWIQRVSVGMLGRTAAPQWRDPHSKHQHCTRTVQRHSHPVALTAPGSKCRVCKAAAVAIVPNKPKLSYVGVAHASKYLIMHALGAYISRLHRACCSSTLPICRHLHLLTGSMVFMHRSGWYEPQSVVSGPSN